MKIAVLPQDDKSRSKPFYSLLVGLGYTQHMYIYIYLPPTKMAVAPGNPKKWIAGTAWEFGFENLPRVTCVPQLQALLSCTVDGSEIR